MDCQLIGIRLPFETEQSSRGNIESKPLGSFLQIDDSRILEQEFDRADFIPGRQLFRSKRIIIRYFS